MVLLDYLRPVVNIYWPVFYSFAVRDCLEQEKAQNHTASVQKSWQAGAPVGVGDPSICSMPSFKSYIKIHQDTKVVSGREQNQPLNHNIHSNAEIELF